MSGWMAPATCGTDGGVFADTMRDARQRRGQPGSPVERRGAARMASRGGICFVRWFGSWRYSAVRLTVERHNHAPEPAGVAAATRRRWQRRRAAAVG